jgi:phage/plasmid-associated DNA primase
MDTMYVMDVIQFLDNENIKWFPINVNEKKEPSYPSQYKAKCSQNDFKTITDEELKYRKQFLHLCNAIAFDTSEVAIIDVDYKDNVDYSNEDGYLWVKQLQKTYPWKKGNCKKQGKHVFARLVEDAADSPPIPLKPEKGRIQTKYKDIEILCGQWCFAPYCKIKRLVRNVCSIKNIYPHSFVKNKDDLAPKKVIVKKMVRKKKKINYESDSGNESPTPPSEFKELGDLIDIQYLDDYDSWTKIVWSLANNSKKNYDLAKYLSMKSDKYDEKGFNNLWNNTRSGNTIGTFLHYCKISNKTQYFRIKSKKYFEFNDGILATLFLEEMADCLTYKEVERQPIFMFNERTGRWTNNIDIIRKKISSVLDDTLSEMRRYIDDSLRGMYNQILNSIYNKSRMDSIVSCLRQEVSSYRDIDFDMNKYLLGFKSKVFDLTTYKLRPYRKDDYITLFIDYDLEEKTEEGQEAIDKLFCEIFPDECFRHDYLARLCAGIYGITHEEFVLANGGGGNGKGVINELHHYMLTDKFCYKANNSILLKAVKNGLNTCLANMDKKRTIFYSEPEESEKIKISVMKELTGCQVMNAERKYSMNNKVDMMGTHILECNKKPKLDGTLDNSVVRRIRDIPFKSTFVDEEDYYEDKYIFLKNTNFKTEEFKHEMKHQLFHYYIDFIKDYYKTHNKNLWEYMHTSTETANESKKYIDDSDALLEYLYEACKPVEGCILSLKDLYIDFKLTDDYVNSSKEDKRKMNYKWFCEYFRTHRILKKYYKERHQPIIDGEQKCYRRILIGFQIKEDTLSNDLDIL